MDFDVLKFGGSSSANPETIRQVLDVTRMHYAEKPRVAIVVSAFGVRPSSEEKKTTDKLFGIADCVWEGSTDLALDALKDVMETHLRNARGLSVREDVFEPEISQLEEIIKHPQRLDLKEASDITIVRYGEILAAKFYTELLNNSGIPAVYVNAGEHGFITDSKSYAHARLLDTSLKEGIARHFQSLVAKHKGKIPVYTGYISKNQRGELTALGRDGSNTTAMALGAAINASGIYIYSDVPGVLKIDPRLYAVKEPQTIRRLSYPEIDTLSLWGVKVFQPESVYVLPKTGKFPPIHMKGTSNPEDPGTLITPEAVKGHSMMKGLALIGGLSYREFPVNSPEQFENIQDIIKGYEGVSLFRSDYCESKTGRTGKFIIKVDANKAEDDPEYFREELFYKIMDEVYGERGQKVGPQLHGMAILTAVGQDLGNSLKARAQFESVLGECFDEDSSDATRRIIHNLPQIVGEHSIGMTIRGDDGWKVAKGLYQRLKRINIILYGPGEVGQAFLKKVADGYDELGLNIVGIVDSKGYVTRVGGLTGTEVADVIYFKEENKDNSFDGSRIGDLETIAREPISPNSFKPLSNQNRKIFQKLLRNEKGDFVLVDATSSKQMLETLMCALGQGEYWRGGDMRIISANKMPYAAEIDPKKYSSRKLLSNLFEEIRVGRVLNRATVGANLGVPETALEILNQNPRSITLRGCMSGTLGYICSRMDEGVVKFSQAVDEAIQNHYPEPTPYTDLSGRDVLNKTLILWRMIAQQYNIQFDDFELEYETFLDPAIKLIEKRGGRFNVKAIEDKKGSDFVKEIKALDYYFQKIREQSGRDMVLRYVGSIGYDGEKYHLKVGLIPVHKESILGSLRGTDNAFLFGVDGQAQKLYFPPGPGAGVETTSQALYGCLVRCVRELRHTN